METMNTNLKRYQKAIKKDSRITHYFIGAVSNYVDPEDWDRAIETALECIKEYEGGEQ